MKRSKELEQETGQKISVTFQLIIDPVLRTGKEDVRDWVLLKKDGSIVEVTMTVHPLFDEEDHTIIGFLEVAKPKKRESPPVNL